MSWLFSQALVEEYLGDTSLDGEQSAPLSGNNTQQAYCAPDKMTKFSRLSRFGMTYKPLTEDRGEELLTLYLADFHAKTLAQRGGGAGITGERSSMWKHMARIIGEVRPRYVFVENSPMLTTRGLGVVLADLSSLGFDAKWGVVSAADIGANHQRERIWIRAETNVAYSESCGSGRNTGKLQTKNEQQTSERQEGWVWQSDNASKGNGKITDTTSIGLHNQENKCVMESQRGSELQLIKSRHTSKMAYTSEIGFSGEKAKQRMGGKFRFAECGMDRNWWAREPEFTPRTIEPNVGRVANGVAARVDRLKAIGNGQVPLCAATAWELLK